MAKITHQNPHLHINQGRLETFEEGLVLAGDPIIFANVLLEAPNRHGRFFLTKPGRGSRKVGQNKVCSNGNHNGNYTFNDEQPSPCSESKVAV